MLRPGPRAGPSRLLALAVALATAAELALQASRLFVGAPLQATRLPAPRVALRAEEEAAEGETLVEEGEGEEEAPAFEGPRWPKIEVDRGIDLDGDDLSNLDDFYKETIDGTGGMPTGFIRDLILRSFYGTWNSKNYFVPSREYTGENMQPCATDYETAYETMRTNMKESKYMLGKDDKTGWIWLACTQNPGGLQLYLAKTPPFGERPLAIIKSDNVDEFFDKVDWNRLYVRLHKWQLWGGTANKFPFPIVPGYWKKLN